MRTGVFICQAGAESPGGVSFHSVESYAANLPNVERVRNLGVGPKLDPSKLSDEIKQAGLERVVIAGDSPGFFKPVFTKAMALAGGDPDEVRLASFGQHHASGDMGTPRAESIVACAVLGVPFPLAARPGTTATRPGTLIIGGGVAGIQAALEIADAGKQVYLVERQPTIGGHMAMFDKTFPTLDCAACILTPKMVAVGQHEMIELHDVLRSRGRQRLARRLQRAMMRKKARHVDIAACVACNACTESCPRRASSEFDSGIATRKSIYIPFPQAVPNAYVLDEASCLYFESGGEKCGVCAKKCPKLCIDLAQKDEVVEFEVGNIVLATGYDVYDAAKIERYGYGVLPNVFTALEFERMTNASGPTGGKIVTKSQKHNKRTKTDEWVLDPEGPPPRSVAIVHCVGSRDAQHNAYCSRVCCMYSLKFAHLVKEKLPDATCYEYYIDMRAFGKGYEEFAERIVAEGTFVVRGRTASVSEVDGQMVIKGEDILSDRMVDSPVDMVILAVGLIPARGSDRHRPDARDRPRLGRVVQRAGLQLRSHRHRAGRGLRGRSLPGSEGHPRHRSAGFGGRGRGAQECDHRAGARQPGRTVAERHRGSCSQPRSDLRRHRHGDPGQSQAHRRTGGLWGGRRLQNCYHCGNCSAVCPFSKEPYIFPRRPMRYLQMGLEKKLEGSLEPWLCYYCGECSEECPRGAEPGETMMSLRRWLTSRYDFTGISRLFYRSGKVELVAVIVAALLTGLGFVLWGMSQGSIHHYDGPNAFLPSCEHPHLRLGHGRRCSWCCC